jgi:hypothetical protein
MSAFGSVTLQTTVPLAGPPSGWTPRIGVLPLLPFDPLLLLPLPPLDPEPLPEPFVLKPLGGVPLEQAPITRAQETPSLHHLVFTTALLEELRIQLRPFPWPCRGLTRQAPLVSKSRRLGRR